jgi:hypothetical protein
MTTARFNNMNIEIKEIKSLAFGVNQRHFPRAALIWTMRCGIIAWFSLTSDP